MFKNYSYSIGTSNKKEKTTTKQHEKYEYRCKMNAINLPFFKKNKPSRVDMPLNRI